jgi:hypothetical protein
MFYYSEDGQLFSNRIQAVRYSLSYNKKVYVNYYDEVYDKLNWKIEPPEPIEYYYKEQAQRIRDQYDYLILCYSGGYDSTNILETYHFNNIKLNKIICVGAFSQDSYSGTDENHNGELYHNSFPYLKELGLESITQTIDYTKMFDDVSQFSIYEYGDTWMEQIGSKYSPHNWFWRDLDRYVVPDSQRDKKIGIIFGCDKPYLYEHNNKKIFCFMDTPLSSYGRFNPSKRYNTDYINFYWDPTYPNILMKQLHILKNGWQQGHDFANKSVYNLRKPLIYRSAKSVSPFLSSRDSYLKTKHDNKLYEFFKSSVLPVQHLENNLRNIGSKFYAIE